MYYELIYTRCRQGIDILREGRPITSDGYKVYSCSSALFKDDIVDLQFLLNAAQAKQPYNEPDFMDDAYMYYVPDKGSSFMLNFYPVPFDPNTKGDYAHRAGNFLNHILVGDFTELYPYELFRNNAIWNAKTRGEAYYYEYIPTDLPLREDVNNLAGQFGIEEIGAFISDGRKEALKAAISFLISQYELPPEERKFLVIKDESSQKIEMWIAAIEYAFSPRISASLSFATRMDKFITANRYTVNQLGVYQTQINLQDRNQQLRYRAMIIGVDDRDRINSGAARALENSPFVLLNGIEKKAMFEADISNKYFRFIVRFDYTHQIFSREFLQIINITTPSSDIFNLYSIFEIFENPSLPTTKEMGKIATLLSKYTLHNSSRVQHIYTRVSTELPRFLQEDLHSALLIIKWLYSVSQIVNDTNAAMRFTDYVCKAFMSQVLSKTKPEDTFNFWQSIKNSEFISNVAKYFINTSTIQDNKNPMHGLTGKDITTYVLIYLDCAAFIGTFEEKNFKDVVNWGLKNCYHRNDKNDAKKILKAMSNNRHINVQDILLSIARNAEGEYAEYIIIFLIENDNSIVSSDSSIMAFLKKLSNERMEHLFGSILKIRSKALSKVVELDQMIRLLDKLPSLSDIDKANILAILDQKINLNEKGSIAIAKMIQEAIPRGASCKKSAHIIALNVLYDKRKRSQFTSIYNELINQGFPSIEDDDYIRALIEALFKANMDKNELYYVIQLFSKEQAYITELVSAILGITSSKQTEEWNQLMIVAAKNQNPTLINIIIKECAKLKQGEKALSQLSDLLNDNETCDYFQKITQKSKEIIRSQKSQSGFRRMFNKFFSRDDDCDKKRR